ncbi:NADH-quinone oxidoreductase subunit J [Verticiella sediminum]|uniref:NADH-quinone oxidoreductase subunit J n=1 Tax=Verticiella sediminum TaxID=1247510 RepID=A0A556AVR3_9BURK|nr:NADH-quinone oxidoreductase subunit J [Verticiella sediminum]TSH97043.1 NADH-quinone oxidoreductase subunit J [Verticiella sediminum]
MTVTTVLFYLFAAILVVAAFRVVTARSPVTAAMHLVLAFFTAAMLWMLIHVEFLALLLVLVYVGAVMVLFLFVVMMLDIDMSELRAGTRAYMPLGMVIAAVMVAEMSFVLARTWWEPGAALPVPPEGYNNTLAIGTAMYTEYIYGIEIAAVLLLVGMVAAISLTLRRRTDVKRNVPSEQLKVQRADRVRLVNVPAQRERAAATESAQGDK